jgi:squalene cyclase
MSGNEPNALKWLGLAALAVLLASTGAARGAEPAAAVDDAPTPPPEGVSREVELSILRGLKFLVESQKADGSWNAPNDDYPVAMTALAGLALLSSGSTATRGPCAQAIRRAEAFLLATSSDDGLFTTGWEGRREQRPMYGHAFTMTFLAQLLGQEESLDRQGQIRIALGKAVELTARAQTNNGGWYYYPNASQDEGTLTVTMMQGLRACRDAGIHVPKQLIDRGVKYIERSANENGSVRYRIDYSEIREGVTCAAVVALWSAGRYKDDLLRKINDYMDRNIHAQWGTSWRHGTYVQYYLAQAKYLKTERWLPFYKGESRLLVDAQDADGSWTTQEEMGQHGVGTIYSTAVALIILQLPYNRLPIFQR